MLIILQIGIGYRAPTQKCIHIIIIPCRNRAVGMDFYVSKLQPP